MRAPRLMFRRLAPLVALAAGSCVGLLGTDVALADADGAMTRARSSIFDTSFFRSTSANVSPDAPIAPTAATDTHPPPPIDPSTLPDRAPFPRMNPTANVGRAWLLAEGPAHESSDKKRLVTITFDDGPVPETTPAILKTLARYDVHATFFFIGRYLDGNEPRAIATRAVAESVLAAGHAIGNHTHDHLLLTTTTHAHALAQIEEGAASIERAIHRRPVFFRPPYGQLDPFTEDVLQKRDDEVVMWNVEAGDMLNDDPFAMAASLEQQIMSAGGGIVLLHDVRPSTVRTLPKLLAWLRAHAYDPARPDRVGYEVVDLAEYLRATSAHPQPYSDRAEVEQARKDAARRSTQPMRPES